MIAISPDCGDCSQVPGTVWMKKLHGSAALSNNWHLNSPNLELHNILLYTNTQEIFQPMLLGKGKLHFENVQIEADI